MLKGKRKLDRYLTNWCQENGFDVKCRLAPDFEYDSDRKTLYYSLTIVPEHDELFYKCVCKPLLTSDEVVDIFPLSFFHELGHKATQDDFDDEDECEYCEFVDKLDAKKELTVRDLKKYYFQEMEYAATCWGCDYINHHKRKVDKFYEGFVEEVLEFYAKNKLEDEDGDGTIKRLFGR